MLCFSIKVKNADIGDSENPLEIDLNEVFGGVVNDIASVTTVKLDDVYSIMTFTGTVAP
ncbi:hypothetical protein [Aureispira sp. CCB-QB1]|uniref:hypothetical protein n=1 Tax=Aureispira sp. CCB-QB1 TaxID=1313421 RepID=UPI000A701945|nr:hypothetical protein [Aureispira sp. CCB-QB1]